MATLSPLNRPRNLRETVLDTLRSAIITGELAEGELVSAPTLGEQLGVSATPVREAMMDLSREGLVETVKNKGFRITAMSEKDLDDLTAIRLLLEPPAMRLVAGNIPDEAFDRLTSIADACLGGADEQNLTEYLRHDRDFHALLLSFAGNRQLTDLATSLRSRTRLYGIAALARDGKLSASAKEHHELIAVLRSGDGPGAEALLARHIGHARSTWATGEDAEHDPTPAS
ncbi:DNA-binding GntR family transcriptional regulator [Brevibacterium sanguinis]|uniref:DNA-binding GntR family transcriptional regulator n=2 Tax=Brevibacterium TaxID=1696 RepID=A0A366IEQ7_9MICO|nr:MULTISPECIES: GntR family transcriptional regulator [Brevibacterium]RBP62820.1 DNA-binding GntR family transcriptional regulator [Brevibacterium sanguinis]RBP69385.1 DNA-binding GntR family transcriptional regulator [Brevibacterium celere]